MQLNFENLDVVDVFVSLLFQIIDFSGKLPLVFLAVFDLSQTADGVALGEGANVGVRILHNHIVVRHRLSCHLLTILAIPLACFLLLHLHNLPLLLQGLRVGSYSAKLSDALLSILSFLCLCLAHVNLSLQIAGLNLANVLLVGSLCLLRDLCCLGFGF